MFRFIISYFCKNLKLIGWFLPKLWQLTFFFSLMWRYRGKCYFTPKLYIWPAITFEPLIVKKSLTPRWKALVSLFTVKSIWNPFIASFLLTSAFFLHFFAKNSDMTSHDVTWRHMTRFSLNLCKVIFKSISYLLPKIKSFAYVLMKLQLFTFLHIIFRSSKYMTSPTCDRPPINFEWRIPMTQNFQEMCETKF